LPSTSKELLRGGDALRQVDETVRVIGHGSIVPTPGGLTANAAELRLDDGFGRPAPPPIERGPDRGGACGKALATRASSGLDEWAGHALGLGLAQEL
jgi:hypothetical protein